MTKIKSGQFFVGVDLSLNRTGMAFIQDDDFKWTTVEPKEKGMNRLAFVTGALSRVICTEQKTPKLVAIESMYSTREGGLLDRAEMMGVLKLKLWKIGIPFVMIPPAQVKQFLTGKGNSKKEHMLMHAFKHYKIEFKNTDECDAFVLAKMAQAFYTKKSTAWQRKIISKIGGRDAIIKQA